MSETLPEHHVGNPRSKFRNPWPSFHKHSGLDALRTRFRKDRNFVPVPKDLTGLVQVRKPTWGRDAEATNATRLKATWVGHATWFLELPAHEVTGGEPTSQPGLSVLFDPVFSFRTSPVTWAGPKRYNSLPCAVADLPRIDIVVISHNHYDHLDLKTIRFLCRRSPDTHFLCPLGNKAWFVKVGIPADRVTELDWWDRVEVINRDGASAYLVCTPAQHTSARSLFDRDRTLWSSWTILDRAVPCSEKPESTATVVTQLDRSWTESQKQEIGKRFFFAGDTGYRAVRSPFPTAEEESNAPVCPVFREIGDKFGPFDLALLPIGLFLPRDFLSAVHCAPEDSVCIHRDIRSKKSVGMHYGTFRGGISHQFEPVTEPPLRWRAECEKAGLKWGVEADLCDIGETVLVD